jgi:CubicO group peptidase (beta-lactamase class C family)
MKNTYHQFFLAIFLLGIMTCQAQFKASYTTPSYNDATRNARIQKTFPVIEKMYKEYAEKNHFPGYAFGIVVDGQLVFKGSGGYANLEEKIEATSTSMFRIASMSKSFTAMAILQLRDAGKLKLDDAVEKYIPALRGQGLTKDTPPITIRHLMTHDAGFPEDNPWGDRQLAVTEEKLISFIQKGISFSTATGLEYEYSNLGFTMLGYIIHKVSGLPYDVYIEKNILKPLGMQGTTYEYSKVPGTLLANGYRYINNQWKKEALLHNGIYGSMGGMITSIDMFSKYVAFHEMAWPARNDQETLPLKRSSIREMNVPANFISLTTPYTFMSGRKLTTTNSYSYGLNWMNDAENRKSIGHSVGLPGFGSNWRFMPEYGIGVILFANVTYAPTSILNISILDTIVQLAQLKPRAVSVSPILTIRQNELITSFQNWNHPASIFAINFFDDYPKEMLIQQTTDLLKQVGKILRVNPMSAENQLRGYCIIDCEKGQLKLSFTLSPENPALIQEYHLTKITP